MNDRDRQWDKLFIDFAVSVSNMSRARRLKVGAVAVRDRRVIAIGYNGTPAGEDNCCEVLVEYDEDIMSSYNQSRIWRDDKPCVYVTKPNVIHAEDNLIKFANENSISLVDCVLYITHSPCSSCGNKIIAERFKKIIFKDRYRIVSDLSKITKSGISVEQWIT